jgi:hypothetical protein
MRNMQIRRPGRRSETPCRQGLAHFINVIARFAGKATGHLISK